MISRIPYISHRLILLGDVVISLLSTMLSIFATESLLRIFLPSRSILLIYLLSIPASLVGFLCFHTHKSIIRHSNLQSLWRILAAVAVKCLLLLPILYWILPASSLRHFSLSLIPCIDLLMTMFLLVVFRVGLISAYQIATRNIHDRGHRLLIFGERDDLPNLSALLNLNFRSSYHIVGVLSFNPDVRSTYHMGNLPIYFVQDMNGAAKLLHKEQIEGILFASQRDLLAQRNGLVEFCIKHHLRLFTVPPIDRWKHTTPQAREVSIEDLLGRDEIKINMPLIRQNLQNKTVLITGAAGSIGSELCRQIATMGGIKRLVLFDFCETGMHNLRLELEERFPELEFYPIVGDVRARRRVDFVFRTYHPDVVFHAAAYKHVPLMEANPCEAIRVNAIGTRYVADTALRYNCEKFVMISTDKAVNPTSVMGASKRLAEIYVQSLDRAVVAGKKEGRTRFITTRFGNVLGSQGSVIPRFKDQIAKGGPVTVTHPKITRFFMTIPEACRLVLEASVIGQGGDIMVFDMGEPVRIADLAERMIKLAGFIPGEDIEIVYTGLRPGEKLYEEVLNNAEITQPSPHEKIRIATVREYPYEEVANEFETLKQLALDVNIEGCVQQTKHLIPEYKSNNSEFEKLDK
ncbi:MAG: polysaccharide biosynthesis protein [Bacteroidales bacterium]|nr:polysaccharide biosynthesis protein [Bacteroidales bacterium]